MQIVLVYLQPFRRNSLLNCVSQPEIAKKITKTAYFGGVKVIDVDILMKLITSAFMISGMSVPISVTVYTLYEPKSGKIRKPPHPGAQNFVTIN